MWPTTTRKNPFLFPHSCYLLKTPDGLQSSLSSPYSQNLTTTPASTHHSHSHPPSLPLLDYPGQTLLTTLLLSSSGKSWQCSVTPSSRKLVIHGQPWQTTTTPPLPPSHLHPSRPEQHATPSSNPLPSDSLLKLPDIDRLLFPTPYHRGNPHLSTTTPPSLTISAIRWHPSSIGINYSCTAYHLLPAQYSMQQLVSPTLNTSKISNYIRLNPSFLYTSFLKAIPLITICTGPQVLLMPTTQEARTTRVGMHPWVSIHLATKDSENPFSSHIPGSTGMTQHNTRHPHRIPSRTPPSPRLASNGLTQPV